MSTATPTILIVGLGHLGGVLLEFLAREDWIGRLVACSRNRERGEARCNLARVSAAAQGSLAHLDYRQCDISDSTQFAEIIDSVSPDLILGTATMQTWWLPELLPSEARDRIREARFGVWLPLHLAPTRDFMKGVRLSSFRGPVLTAPFPDVVNTILAQIGLAPSCGIGNVDEIVAKVRLLAAERLRAPWDQVQVLMVAHHSLESSVFGGHAEQTPPYFLRVFLREIDVTDEISAHEILFKSYDLPSGPGPAFLTAGSTLRLIRSLFDTRRTLLHAPAPGGLPGGYPISVAEGRIEAAPIPGLELEEAVLINERSHPFDGIQGIESDGTTVFNPESAEIMRSELGYDCSELSPADAASRGEELLHRFREYALRNGVDLKHLA